ncbi:MAG: stage V sporulation protein AE [Clostridia bacterium]|nr:stage V sporulation protein AE [Clostridia bacterium]
MKYVWCFVIGGLICIVGQILIDKTKLTSARILVLFVTLGVILTGLGLYEPIVNLAGSGATVPLTGFGYSLAKGAIKGVQEEGLLGAFTGGIKATAGGISAAIIFGFIAALISKPKIKD